MTKIGMELTTLSSQNEVAELQLIALQCILNCV